MLFDHIPPAANPGSAYCSKAIGDQRPPPSPARDKFFIQPRSTRSKTHFHLSNDNLADASGRTAAEGVVRRGHGLPGLDRAGHEGCLHLGHGIVDGDSRAFVQDLDPVDLHRRAGAVLAGAGQGDVEGQDLIAVPGTGHLLEAADGGELLAVQVVDGRAEGNAVGAHQGGVEDGVLRQVGVTAGLELGTDVIDVGTIGR